VYGVVVEVTLSGGLDTLAAYADGSARYLNWSGKAIVWDAPRTPIGALVGAVIEAGERIVPRIGPWDGPRRGPPPLDHVRLNMLTPSGLHFGEGPMDVLSNDAIGGPLVAAAVKLLQALTAQAK
jgi:hypothetical protein